MNFSFIETFVQNGALVYAGFYIWRKQKILELKSKEAKEILCCYGFMLNKYEAILSLDDGHNPNNREDPEQKGYADHIKHYVQEKILKMEDHEDEARRMLSLAAILFEEDLVKILEYCLQLSNRIIRHTQRMVFLHQTYINEKDNQDNKKIWKDALEKLAHQESSPEKGPTFKQEISTLKDKLNEILVNHVEFLKKY